jgi:hypothetical protein
VTDQHPRTTGPRAFAGLFYFGLPLAVPLKGLYRPAQPLKRPISPRAVTGRDKTLRRWQQPVDAAVALIRALTRPGATVCDLVVGSGTTIGNRRANDRRPAIDRSQSDLKPSRPMACDHAGQILCPARIVVKDSLYGPDTIVTRYTVVSNGFLEVVSTGIARKCARGPFLPREKKQI